MYRSCAPGDILRQVKALDPEAIVHKQVASRVVKLLAEPSKGLGLDGPQMKARVFHGTNAKFSHIENKFLGSANGTVPINRTGFNLTDNKALAGTFDKHLLSAEVHFSSLLTLDAKGTSYAEFKHTLNARLEKLDRTKHDAVVIQKLPRLRHKWRGLCAREPLHRAGPKAD